MFSDPKKNVLEFGFIPGQKVVDFGSGAGHYSAALSHALGSTGRVIAVDLDKGILVKLKNDAIKAGRENILIIDGDVEKVNGTKLRDGFADGAVFSNILYQLEDIKGAIAEAKRVVRSGGKVCIVEWADFSLLQDKLSNKKSTSSKKPVDLNKARELFEEAGFVFERSFNAGEHHYGAIFKLPLQ
ncbi:MAG: class I SAM-dependent methyltransferase [Minisyncoccota bacterium]